MTHDDVARIKTDDLTLDEIAAGYQPGPHDEKLVQYAAAYRDTERLRAMQTLSQLYADSQQSKKRQATRKACRQALFVVVIVSAVLGLFTDSLAFTLVAAAAMLTAWVLGRTDAS